MSRIRKMKGFTLIELIVVVIILGILAAIAAVAYNSFVGKSKDTVAYADAKTLANAINVAAASDANGSGTPLGELSAASQTAAVGTTVTFSPDVKVTSDAVVTVNKATAGAPTELKVAVGTHQAFVELGSDVASAQQTAA